VLLLELLRHIYNPLVRAVIFRRTYAQIKQPGGLWDTARMIYPRFGGVFNETGMYCRFPSGMQINFAHMQHEKHKQSWDGSQLTIPTFDELQHFSESQYTYVSLSRARSMSGVKPYSRSTLNPDPDGWVRVWVDWYIGEDGWPREDRAGLTRYFFVDQGETVWGENPEQIIEKYPKTSIHRIKSFCFVPAKLEDNPALNEIDPAYGGNIDAMPDFQALRLKGNWNARPNAGSYFKPNYFQIIDILPTDIIAVIRNWDLASTAPHEGNKDPDWLVGSLWFMTKKGHVGIIDVVRDRLDPGDVEPLILRTSHADREQWGSRYTIGMEVEGGSTGKIVIENYARKLGGFKFAPEKPRRNKEIRATPLASHAKNLGIWLMRAPWNKVLIDEYHAPVGDGVDGGARRQPRRRLRVAIGRVRLVRGGVGVAAEEGDIDRLPA
jgi:predicted phage terminase large subunit-like protein